MRSHKAALALVRAHVNEWDPVGLVGAGCPNDEYDCISMHIISLLSRRVSDADFLDWARSEIPGHFGTALVRDSRQTRRFLRKLRAEWDVAGIQLAPKRRARRA